MATLNMFDSLPEAVAEKIHDLGSDTLKVMLTNTAPIAANTQKSDLVEVAAANGYTAGGTQAVQASSAQTGGTYKLVLADVTFTAAGGSFGPFQYAVLYNDSAINDELICWWAYTTSTTLGDGETFTVDFDATTGVITIGPSA